jgi:hypothetical protein
MSLIVDKYEIPCLLEGEVITRYDLRGTKYDGSE